LIGALSVIDIDCVNSLLRLVPKLQNCSCPQLLQVSTNFDIFWHKHAKEDKIMRDALTFHHA